MVMTLALLVYAVAQRQLRQPLAHRQATVPNHINQPTTTPTLRWVFQLLTICQESDTPYSRGATVYAFDLLHPTSPS